MNKNLKSDSINIELKCINKDTILEYKLVVNASIVLNQFLFKKNEIEVLSKYSHISNNEKLFKIYDFLYVEQTSTLYILLDEWGQVKLYEYNIDFLSKLIKKKDERLVFTYTIRSLDFGLYQSECLAIEYIDNSIMLMTRFPLSAKVSFIRISLNGYEKNQIFIIDNSSDFIYVDHTEGASDPFIPLNSDYSMIIPSILKEKIKGTPYSSFDFKYCFTLQNQKQEIVNDNKLHIDNSYFFCKLGNKNVIIHCFAPQWIFSEYSETDMNPNKPF